MPAGFENRLSITLPTTMKSGWVLSGSEDVDRIAPFIDLPGLHAGYCLTASDGTSLWMDIHIAECNDFDKAAKAYDLLTDSGSLPRKELLLEIDGIIKYEFRQGFQDSPAAAADATGVDTTRIAVWMPPYIVVFNAHNSNLGKSEVEELLSAL